MPDLDTPPYVPLPHEHEIAPVCASHSFIARRPPSAGEGNAMAQQVGALQGHVPGQAGQVRWFHGTREKPQPQPSLIYTTGDGRYFHREKKKPNSKNLYPLKCYKADAGCPVRPFCHLDGSGFRATSQTHNEQPDTKFEAYLIKRRELFRRILHQDLRVSCNAIYKPYVQRQVESI